MTGKKPFHNEPDEMAVLGAIYHRRFPEPTDEPIFTEFRPLWTLMATCWSGDSGSRPTAELVSQTLMKLVSGYLGIAFFLSNSHT